MDIISLPRSPPRTVDTLGKGVTFTLAISSDNVVMMIISTTVERISAVYLSGDHVGDVYSDIPPSMRVKIRQFGMVELSK